MKTLRQLLLEKQAGTSMKIQADAHHLAALARPSSIIANVFREIWLEAVAPWQRVWLGIAAVWLGLLALQFSVPKSSRRVDGPTGQAQVQWRRLAREQRQLLALLTDPAPVAESPRKTPVPRSELARPIAVV